VRAQGDQTLEFIQITSDGDTKTRCCMKSSAVTIRVDAKLDRELKRLSRSLRQSKSEIARDALKRQVTLLRFRKTRQAILSEIEAKSGILTDEDVFPIVS
jgi:predicted transcriptional regulator